MTITVPYKAMLVALSGGADSVVLLHILVKQGIKCVAAHCNFHLRGEESNRDEAFVRDYCKRLNVECRVKDFDTERYAAEKRVSIEMAARELRYSWFEKLLDEYDLPCVAVAHHADDNTETFLLNLIRGTGIKGLCGMKSVNGRVVRPLLGYSRDSIEAYCKINHLKYVIDSTNQSDDYTRNRIRHHIVPAMKELNPSVLSTMNGNMTRLESILRIFQKQYDQFVSQAVEIRENGFEIKMKSLTSLDEKELFLFELLYTKGFTADSVEKIVRCIDEKRFGREFATSGYELLIDRSALIVRQRVGSCDNMEYEITADSNLIDEPIKMRISQREVDDDFILSRHKSLVHLDFDKLKFPLSLRRWRKGDIFVPIGLKGVKKLSDFFVDIKLSRYAKEQVWLLTSADDEILWVVGHRISEKVKYTKHTKRIIEIELL